MAVLSQAKIDSIRGVYGRTYDDITAPVSKDGTTWLPSGVLTSESTSYANRLKNMGVATEPGAQGSVKGMILCPWTSFGYTGNPGPGDDPAQAIDLDYFEDALQAHLDPANHGGVNQFGAGKKAIAFVNWHSWAYANTGDQNKINLSSRATYGSGGSYHWANTSGYGYSSSFNILNTAAQNWYIAWLEGVISAIENSAICQQYLAGLMGGETADGKLEEIYNAGLFPGTSWSQAAMDSYWVREMQVYSDNLVSYPWFAGFNFLSGTKPRAFDDFRTSSSSTQGYKTVMQDAFPTMAPTVGLGGPDWGGFGYKIDTASDDNQTYGPRWGQVIGSTRPVLAHRELLSNATWDLPVQTVRNSFTSFSSWTGVSQEHKDEITNSWDREIARNGGGNRGVDAEGSFDQSYHVARAICGVWCDSGVGTGDGLDSQATLNAAVQKWAPLFYEGNPLSLGGGDAIEPGPSKDKTYLEFAGQVMMRVANNIETIARSGHSWDVTTSYPGYLGPSALQALPDTGAVITNNIALTAPSIELEVKFQNPGTYWIWGRGQSFGADDNSYHVGVDGFVNPDFSATQIVVEPNWVWGSNRASPGDRGTINIPSTGCIKYRFICARTAALWTACF